MSPPRPLTNASLRSIHPTMKKLRLTFLTAALCAAAPCLHAQMIGVSYGNGATGTNVVAFASPGAPGYTQPNFNNVTTATATALKNNSGTATTAAATVSGTNLEFSYATSTPSGADETLNNGLVFAFANPLTLSLSGIPYASYSLVVYSLDSFGNTPSFFTLGTTTLYANGPSGPTASGYVDGSAATAYTYIRATATTAATATAGADYVVFTGLSGATQTLTVQDTNSSGIANGPSLEAFQIINTTAAAPEPGTWAVVLCGAGVLVLTNLRRQRRRD